MNTRRLAQAGVVSTAALGVAAAAATPAQAASHQYCNANVSRYSSCANRGRYWEYGLTNEAILPNHAGAEVCIDAQRSGGRGYTVASCTYSRVAQFYNNYAWYNLPRVWNGYDPAPKSYIRASELW